MTKRFIVVAFVFAVSLVAAESAAAQSWGGMSEQQHRTAAETMKNQYQREWAACSDKWVAYAFSRVTAGGYPSAKECDIRNFNGGQWSSLSDLLGYMDCYLRRGKFPCGPMDVAVSVQATPQMARVITFINDNISGYADVDRNNRIIAANGIIAASAELVAAGGGNLVAAGGGNLVAAGGGNAVGKPGGVPPGVTVHWPPNLSGGAQYRLQAATRHSLGRYTPNRTRGNDKEKDPLADIGKQMFSDVPKLDDKGGEKK